MRYLLAIAFVHFCCGVCFAERVCVAEDTATLMSAPGTAVSRVLLEVPRYYPLVAIGSSGDFYEVADYRRRRGWIRKSAVAFTDCVVVVRENVNVRQGPSTNHATVFRAKEGVAFQVLQENGSWMQIRHEGGEIGWIHKDLVWGAD